ncbi:BRCA1-associated RING domain protein 1 [Linnemannia gamsii]|uniref:BRCA1-associated RING domain protein 1 n=1 Tax=Linnemannia gamsii TaxID=64522 RepID=A0ABQ7JZT9_9FUNG|nr:BRCA1-associated RING domain protein 1 [Linnemannia gamsii]
MPSLVLQFSHLHLSPVWLNNSAKLNANKPVIASMQDTTYNLQRTPKLTPAFTFSLMTTKWHSSDELHSTYTVKECGHHFCQKCIYPVLGTDCVCPTCDIPARVGNLVKNPSYDILVACVTKLRNIRLAQDSNEEQDTRETSSSQDRDRDLEQGTFIGTPIWTYDCGPTFPNIDHFSTLSNVEAQTFPSIDAAMTMHRREREIQEKTEAKQEQEQAVSSSQSDERGHEFSSEDGTAEIFTSQQTEILGDDDHHPVQPQSPPTISQLQRLLSIQKANSPAQHLLQESEISRDPTPYSGDYSEPPNGVTSNFNTPRMPTPSFRRIQLDLGSQFISDSDQLQEQQISNRPSRKRRMQTDEYTGRSGTPSSDKGNGGGNGAASRNKKPLRVAPKRELYSSDTMIAMRDPQQDIRNPPKYRRRKDSVESEKAPGLDGKRPWACTSCLKVMSVGRDVRIDECPACGQNQPYSRAYGGSSTSSTDDDGGDDNDEYGQVIASSQPTLDSERFTLMPSRDFLYLPVNRGTNRPKPPHPQSSRSTNSGPAGSETSTSSPAIPSNTSEPATAISCVFTGLNKEQKDSFDDTITRVIEAGLFMEHMPDQVFNESATHIITSIDSLVWKRLGVALCPRVLKYLIGMLSNGWVVRHEWFLDSIKSRIWLPLPDERYLIQGDAQFGPAPGTHYRRELRQQHSLKLFDSCRMFFYGEFGTGAQKSIKKQELLRLVQCGGASVLMKRPPKLSLPSSTRARSRTPAGEVSEPNSTSSISSVDENVFFSPKRSFLYLTEDIKPWQIPIDKSVPIIVCDPTKIPSGHFTNPCSQTSMVSTAISEATLSPADLKKHGWLRDFQAVSLTWVLNCISCSLMGKADVNLLYGYSDPQEIQELDQAWDSWRANKS